MGSDIVENIKKNRLYSKPGTRQFLSDKKSARVPRKRLFVLRKGRDRKTERKTTQEIAPKTVRTVNTDPTRLSTIEGSGRSAEYLNGNRKRRRTNVRTLRKYSENF